PPRPRLRPPRDQLLTGAQEFATMATTAADLLIDRLITWGIDTIFGFPGDGIIRGPADAAEEGPLRPGTARGGGGLRGLRPRQVHRPARRLPGHQRPRRHPPPQRPLRRPVRRRSRPGHHRTHLPRPDRPALSAG